MRWWFSKSSFFLFCFPFSKNRFICCFSYLFPVLEKYFHLSLNPIDMDIFLDMHEILLFSIQFIFFKLFAIYLVKYFLQTSYAPLSWAQYINSSVIRQEGESQNMCFKQTKRQEMFVFRKIFLLCFVETSVLRFGLLPYYRRIERTSDVQKTSMTSARLLNVEFMSSF